MGQLKEVTVMIQNLIQKILEQIYPTACGMCGRLYKEVICKKCRAKINKEIICKKQFKYMSGRFVKYMYLFKYEKELRKILLLYKFKEKIYLYEFFVKIILKNEKIFQFLKNYDIIIPVPIYYKKLKARGYNQCEIIAKELSKNVKNLQYNGNILIKIKNNLKQSSLTQEERKNNVKDVYMIKDLEKNKTEIQNKNILIFDDIYTTGSTVNECVRTLKKLQPNNIGILTIFRD